jgi:hypothetical protein
MIIKNRIAVVITIISVAITPMLQLCGVSDSSSIGLVTQCNISADMSFISMTEVQFLQYIS